VNPADLQHRRHEPPEGWPLEVFERVTEAVATALVAAYRRGVNGDQALANVATRAEERPA
jgi:hypothetical protein